MIIPTILAFAIPDKRDILPTLYHLKGAGMTEVVFPLPWRGGRSALERTALWVQSARALGLTPILDVGPWLDAGLPAWGMPDTVLGVPPRVREERLIAWWGEVRKSFRPSKIIVRRHPPRDRGNSPSTAGWPEWDRALAVWSDTEVVDVTEWAHLDVRDLAWQEWESDGDWWHRVDGMVERSAWVQPWWVEPGRQASLPTPEMVHEGIGRAFTQVLLVSLAARGVTDVVWHPMRGGIVFGQVPVWGWGTSLDGGASLRPWGEMTPTWLALRRFSLQLQTLSLHEGKRADSNLPFSVTGEVELLAHWTGPQGRLLILRRLQPGEVEVAWPVPTLSARVTVSLTGPGAWMFPLEYPLLRGEGQLLTTTGEIIWREEGERGEWWIVDVTRGMDWVQRLPGQLVYQTGADVRREGDVWWIHFEPGQQGQVVWEVGPRRVHVVAVDEAVADRVWPKGSVGTWPLFMGPDRVLNASENREEGDLWVRVSTTHPRGFIVVDEHPWQLQVMESGKTSVWGHRAGMGGVRLGGPKEWGAPRVVTPALAWETVPWDGPLAPARWEEIPPPRGVPLSPGWHWFQALVPPNEEGITLTVQGVCDVWLGHQRVAGIRFPHARRRRLIPLPPRGDIQPLTLLVWALPPAWNAEETRQTGELDVETPQGAVWRYRAGLRGLVLNEDASVRFEETDDAFTDNALYLHRADFTLEVPAEVWVQFGLAMAELGELAWVFLNGHLVGQWWAGRSREVALWLPGDVLNRHGTNRLVVLHWPRAQEVGTPPGTLVQLCRERVSTVHGTVLTQGN